MEATPSALGADPRAEWQSFLASVCIRGVENLRMSAEHVENGRSRTSSGSPTASGRIESAETGISVSSDVEDLAWS